MIRSILNLFSVVANACIDFWRFLTYPLNDLFSEIGINVPSFIQQYLGFLTFGELLLGTVGLFLVITFIKWVLDIVL